MTMTFVIARTLATADATGGELRGYNNGHICATLEDAYHPEKIHGQTRIPAGTYRLGWHASPRFDKTYRARVERAGYRYHGMIQLLDVPNYEWVLIHCGNTVADTDGCILVGNSVFHGIDGLHIPGGESVPAFLRLYPIMAEAIEKGGAQLQIIDPT
jgi:hypothetical protein